MIGGNAPAPYYRNRSLWGVSIAASVRSIGYGATWPFLAVYFNTYLHMSLLFVGLIFTLNSGISIVFSLFAGYMAAAFGRKFTLVLGNVAGFILYLLLSIFSGKNVAIISTLFVLTAFSGSLVFPSANSIVSDITSSMDREMGYAIYRIMANLGWAIGPLISAIIFSYGFGFIFLFVAIANAFATVIALIFVKTNTKFRSNRSGFLVKDYTLFFFSVPVFLLIMVSSQFSVTLPIYIVDDLHIVIKNLAYFYAVNGIVVVVGQYPISRMMRGHSDLYGLIFGSVFYTIGYLMVSFSHSLFYLIIDMIIITIGENFTSPNISTVASKIAPRDKVGRYMGFIGMINQLARTASPSVGTFILYSLSSSPILVWPAIDGFGISAIILFLVFKIAFVDRSRASGRPVNI
ncbi:multidrug-efflux transporter related protein [Thermoplasma acidophilum]|uniref:Multidrug-efflux transporter related protein n=1 Tax=Thermoplasma acidophilum (strain ATCC 25905 / DSM 1728 / JCM 9062 / NBRC 15155 / AMRC-C165) TaxID=273075 RepID=Q9HIJ3_THEAC|nr:MFS transporter [Thermoplasma acidophilum]CAC12467.1 multidrug-efflux transporter related protein [Thermoplasma acidophilum]